MANRIDDYNCGCYHIGAWSRVKARYTENYIKEQEKEIKQLVEQAQAGWCKMIIATVLKEQKPIRKLLRKYGFKKTPEALSKYDPKNTQCIYYWDSNSKVKVK